VSRMRAVAAAAAIALACAAPQARSAPADHQAAIVVIIGRGINVAQGNAPLAVQGTGFYISTDGYVATVHHLLTKLLDAGADDRTISFEIRTSPTDNSPISAAPIYVSPAADIMVLQAGASGPSVKILHRTDRSRHRILPGTTGIFTAGYPSGYGYTVGRGYIRSTGTLAATPGWTTDLTFKEGESGSPVMMGDDTVVAIAKGQDADANAIGFIVPSRLIPAEYWDSGTPTSAATIATSDSLRVEVLQTPPDPIFREVQVTLTNPHCAPPQRRSFAITPRTGWKIDPSSVTISPISSRGFNGPALIDVAASDRIEVVSQLTNIGGCLLNNTVEADINAEVRARVRFREIPAAPQWTTASIVSLAKGVTAPIPALPSDRLRFSVVTPSGESTPLALRPKDLSKGGLGTNLLDTSRIRERLGVSN